MGLLVLALFVLAIAGLTFLGVRWTRPRPTPKDLQRADEAQSAERASAETIRERVFAYVAVYGPKR